MRTKLLLLTLTVFVSSLFACGPKAISTLDKATAEQPKVQPAEDIGEQQWNSILRQARKEGKVVVYSTTGGDARVALMRDFKAKFGLDLEWVSARAGEIQTRVISEAKNDLNLVDIVQAGTTTYYSLKPYDYPSPADKMLLLPEVTDVKQWYKGKLPWGNEAHELISPLTWIQPIVAINTDLVKDSEMTSLNNVLDPKWRGKISINDPTTLGVGSSTMGMVAQHIMSWDYIKALAKQEPVILRETRVQAEWLAMGKNSIALAARSDNIKEFQDARAPVKYIMTKEGSYISHGGSPFFVMKKAAHPNASIVFVNWFLTKEPQTNYGRFRTFESKRLDVPNDHLPAVTLRDPKVEYPTNESEEFLVKVEPEAIKKFREILLQ